MLKSELIKRLAENIARHGDGEIKVEVLTDLGSRGKEYDIVDVTNAVGFEFEMDYITVIEKENEPKLYTNQDGVNLYNRGKVFTAWDNHDDVSENYYEVIIKKHKLHDLEFGYYSINPFDKVEFVRINSQ